MTTLDHTQIHAHHSPTPPSFLFHGGLFLDPFIPPSFLNCISSSPSPIAVRTISKPSSSRNYGVSLKGKRTVSLNGGFASVSLKNCSNGDEDNVGIKNVGLERGEVESRGRGAVNSSKHFWAGAVAAMVARTVVAPLERLKLEYIVRGEQKKILELVKTIAVTQGLRGFWKGNLVNILRTAPFKAINFCAYDTYRKQLHKFHLFEETANFERFIAGAAAGITATVLCLPLDTIRTRIVAHGGEKLGGVVGAFRYMIQTEGFFSLYKGLLPSIISIAPSSAVFYGVYDILKSAYLNSPEGRERVLKMKLQGKDITTLGQLELGTLRTLLYGAISGACAEASTYPFEVVRRQLQMQVQKEKLSTPSTFIKIFEQGGIPGLYAGLFPSLLQKQVFAEELHTRIKPYEDVVHGNIWNKLSQENSSQGFFLALSKHPETIGCCEGFQSYYYSSDPNSSVLIRAVVGAPDQNDAHSDDRTDYCHSEPATYINTAIVGTLASSASF